MTLEELLVQIQDQLAEAAQAAYILSRAQTQQLIESMSQAIECLKLDLESPSIETEADLTAWYDPVHAYMSHEIEQRGQDYLTNEGTFDFERLADQASEHFGVYGPETTTPAGFYPWAEELGRNYLAWLVEQGEQQTKAAAPSALLDDEQERAQHAVLPDA